MTKQAQKQTNSVSAGIKYGTSLLLGVVVSCLVKAMADRRLGYNNYIGQGGVSGGGCRMSSVPFDSGVYSVKCKSAARKESVAIVGEFVGNKEWGVVGDGWRLTYPVPGKVNATCTDSTCGPLTLSVKVQSPKTNIRVYTLIKGKTEVNPRECDTTGADCDIGCSHTCIDIGAPDYDGSGIPGSDYLTWGMAKTYRGTCVCCYY